ncbi:MAG: carbonic anhydrase [Gemmatimonadota bacterium]
MMIMKLVATGAASFGGALLIGVLAATGREVRRSGDDVAQLQATVDSLRGALDNAMPARGFPSGRPDVLTDFNSETEQPTISPVAFVDGYASVIGSVHLGALVYVAPFASIRGDEGQPIEIGEGTNIQDGAVVHALETTQGGAAVANRTYTVAGKEYAVYIGKRVSLAHQSLVHGPARIDDNVFVGMQAMVFKASIGEGVVIEPGAKVIGVNVAAGRYVPAGQTVTTQKAADLLPKITDDYPYRTLNDAVVHVNTSFAKAYRRAADSAAAASRSAHAPRAASSDAKAASPKKPEPEAAKTEKTH